MSTEAKNTTSSQHDAKLPVSSRWYNVENYDRWFVSNLEALIGGELALVRRGKKKRIDKKMLRDWIDRQLVNGC